MTLESELWQFIRNAMTPAEFKTWVQDHPELEALLGPEMHQAMLSAIRAKPASLGRFKKRLRYWLQDRIPKATTEKSPKLAAMVADMDRMQRFYAGVFYSPNLDRMKVFATNAPGRFVDDLESFERVGKRVSAEWRLVYCEVYPGDWEAAQRRLAELERVSPAELRELVLNKNPKLSAVNQRVQ